MGKKVYKAKYSGKVYNTAHEAAVDNANYLRARKLTEQTNRIPATYIGGNTQQARNAYWQQEPVLQHAVDSIADRYGIDSAGLKYRLNNEGYIDQQIRLRNNPDLFQSDRGYALLNGDNGAGGVEHFGLDDVATLIEQGKVKPINEQWWDIDFTNEKGRQTHGAQGSTVADNIGLVAATLKYFRNKAKEDFPNASEADLDRYAQAYYNRGEAGGKKWAESGAKGYNYKAYGGSKDSPWNNLSIADKAAMMEVAVRNGITDLNEIRQKYNEFAKGGNLYPDGGDLSDDDIEKEVLKKEEEYNSKLVKSINIGYDKDKAFTLTNAGSLTGAHLSEEMTDYLIQEAEKAGVDMVTAFGIPAAESTLGNPTDDRSAWNISSGIRKDFNNVYPGTSQFINFSGDAVNEQDLVNFWGPLENQNPYTQQLEEAQRRAKRGEDYTTALKEGMAYADRLAKRPVHTGSITQQAYEYFKEHGEAYNPSYRRQTGKSYVQHVKKKGNEALQSPEIKQAINNYALRKIVPDKKIDYTPEWRRPYSNSKKYVPAWKKSLGGNLYPDGGYTRENGSPVSFDPITGDLIDQTTGQTGTLILPEVRVNARDPRKPVYSANSLNPNNISDDTYDTASNILDFVPVVGGLNRLDRGEYLEGAVDLVLDALGPFKYVLKGAKGAKMLNSATKIAKNKSKAKKYTKVYDRIASKMEDASSKGILTEEAEYRGIDLLDKAVEKRLAAEEAVRQGKKVLKEGIITTLGKVANQNSDIPRIAVASGVRTAHLEDNTIDALKEAAIEALYGFNDDLSRLDAGNAFLLNDKQQERYMNDLGYVKTKDEDGIKKIAKAVQALKDYRGRDKINIYQIGEDVVPRDSVIPIPVDSVPYNLGTGDNKLNHAGDYPTIYYKHKNPNKKEYFYRDIDLNDYGKHHNTSGTEYGPIQYLADWYDFIGNPFIQKTGIQRLVPVDTSKGIYPAKLRNAYGGNLYPYGGTKKQAFLSSLDQSLKEDSRFDSAEWRQFFTDLANMESGYSPNITNSIGAKGYFQLMPSNRAGAWKNPTQQFHEMYKLTGNNLNYLNKSLTKEDWKRAEALGIDMYGMLAGAHLGGAGNVLKALRGKGNAKDMNGTSVMGYMTKFSQRGKTPTLATSSYVEEPMPLFTPSNPEVFFGGYQAPEIEAPLPSVELEETPQYSEEEIARQERRERLNNLNMLMSLTSPQGSNNSMLDAIGLLMR